MDRNNLSIRQRTSIAQKLPENFEHKLQKFQSFIIAERRRHQYNLSLIGKADQTPLTFDMLSNTTVNFERHKNGFNCNDWSRKGSLYCDACLP